MTKNFPLPLGYHPDVSAARYHADNLCDRPSLSSSLAKTITEKTPLMAWLDHPRLNPNFAERKAAREAKENAKFDLGSAVHDWLSSGGERVKILAGFDDYKSKAAQTLRDHTRDQGFIPLLVKQSEQAQRIVEQVDGTLDRRGIKLGAREAVFIAEDHGVVVRAMMDAFKPPDIYDFKITSINLANDNAIGRHLVDMHYDLRAAFYLRVAELVFPDWAGRLRFHWIMVEKDEPYGVRIIDCDNTFAEMGGRKYRHALGVWQECLEEGRWPHLEHMGRTVPYPSFMENAWLEREQAPGHVMGPVEMLKRGDEGKL